jgi:hypothetical protein
MKSEEMKSEYVNIAVIRETRDEIKKFAVNHGYVMQALVGEILTDFLWEVANNERNDTKINETV